MSQIPSKQSDRTGPSRRIVYGAFKGYGDLLSAAPTIISELNSGAEVTLLIFPQLLPFVGILDFGPNSARLTPTLLPVPMNIRSFREFLRSASKLSPDLVWISPHAVRHSASWKIPMLMSWIRNRFWPNATLAGVASEPGARMFDIKIPINRGLPIASRERTAYALASRLPETAPPERVKFIDRIDRLRMQIPRHDVVFHPGASWDNKKWPLPNSTELVKRLSVDFRLVVLGLPDELLPLRSAFSPDDLGIEFMTGSIEEAVTTIAQSRLAITMDSGAMHIAAALDVPTISLFGPTNPQILPEGTGIAPMYQEKLACQPCWSPHCTQDSVYCMELLTTHAVELKARMLLEAGSVTKI
jgi:hypothetical protein